MAIVNFRFECSRCLKDTTITCKDDANNNFNMHNIIEEAESKGWHIGATVLCPECNKKYNNKVQNLLLF